ncbi:nucleolar RNA-binding protein NIFK [Schizosaccharomyces pombe]|uniref:Uncharacterized RNA-binding protein C1827.05c n=1 Tax=Schizosaccharomyces pombe (strain 972 / ATCC 24843) TaxID=284812 RepID=YQL5_SCHPO|nr:putative RNA-binding protein NIFK [Schizosaccharomyces pombe]O74978.1 RecName: Full=Uncharacterized RNA-binding protein C1827.05c [Schizosaccharomyces pombe 972h-]8ESQ_o Chain o, Uncharacterized RNA-binding protein C1827.05c [Schizosaccharomyces pombe]8ESR_o Chain o, Uncharacterized RNA-binding protein C1827.05c [Schizosaccharomyces pombe]8ETG_o Chain o, Uncharacterized RNA-binding protein C1827.05c [Schizosaccharomyces pombe]8ETH_o Chain o, Uncharacterized RNA-binding protein C1827.05c [Sc|eukprot:NP_588551.1 putative RNA-binding protein NIFK [Schizosaccharomyces pombe]
MSKAKSPIKSSKKSVNQPKSVLREKKVKDAEKAEHISLQGHVDNSDEEGQDKEFFPGFGSSDDDEEDSPNALVNTSRQIMDLGEDAEKTIKKKVSENKNLQKKKGVLYVGRLPHGFYEKQMRMYFSQFGPVLRLRMSRNRKTGSSKHYAFIEFESLDVANVVAETMHNYLLYGKLLQCKVIPEDQVHENMFKGADVPFKRIPHATIARLQHEKPLSKEKADKLITRHNRKLKLKKRKLKELGITLESDVSHPKAASPVASKKSSKKKNKKVLAAHK